MAKTFTRRAPNDTFVHYDSQEEMEADIRRERGKGLQELLAGIAFWAAAAGTYIVLRPYTSGWHWAARVLVSVAGGLAVALPQYALIRRTWFRWLIGALAVVAVIWIIR